MSVHCALYCERKSAYAWKYDASSGASAFVVPEELPLPSFSLNPAAAAAVFSPAPFPSPPPCLSLASRSLPSHTSASSFSARTRWYVSRQRLLRRMLSPSTSSAHVMAGCSAGLNVFCDVPVGLPSSSYTASLNGSSIRVESRSRSRTSRTTDRTSSVWYAGRVGSASVRLACWTWIVERKLEKVAGREKGGETHELVPKLSVH